MGGGSSKSRRMYITNVDNYTSMSSDYDDVISKIQRNFETELEYIKKLNNTPDIDEVHKSIGKLVVMRSKSQQIESKLRTMIPVSPKNEKSLAEVTKLLRSIRYHISMLSLRVPVRAYSRSLPNIRGNDSRVKSQNYDSVALRTKKLNDDYDIPKYDKHFDVIQNVLKNMSVQRKTLSRQDESALLKNITGKLNMIEERLKSTSKPEGASPMNIRARSMQLNAEKKRLKMINVRDRASFDNNRRQTRMTERLLKNNSAYARAYRSKNLRIQNNQSKIVTQQLKNEVSTGRKQANTQMAMSRNKSKADINMARQKMDMERKTENAKMAMSRNKSKAEINMARQKMDMERKTENAKMAMLREKSRAETQAMIKQSTGGLRSAPQQRTQSFMSPQQQPAFVGTMMQNQTGFGAREERKMKESERRNAERARTDERRNAERTRVEERRNAERTRVEERKTKELERKNTIESRRVESRRIEEQMKLNRQMASISKANQRAAEAKETAKERRDEAKERSDAAKERATESKADAIQKRDERRLNRQEKREEEAATRNKKEAGRKEKEEINAKKAAAKEEVNAKRAAAKEKANAKKNNTYTATELIDKYVEYAGGDGFNNSNRESIKTAVLSMKAIVSSQSARMALAKREKLPKEFSKRDKIVKEAAKIYITNQFKEALRTYRQGTDINGINRGNIDKLINVHTVAIKMYGSTVAPVYRTRMNELKRVMDMLNPEEVYIAIELGKMKNTPTKRLNIAVIDNQTAVTQQKSLHPLTIAFFASLKPIEMFKLIDSLSTYKRTGDYFMSTFFKSGIYSARYKEYLSKATGDKIKKTFKLEIKEVLQTYKSNNWFARSFRSVLEITDDQNNTTQNIKNKLKSSFSYLSNQEKYIADFFTIEKLRILKNEMETITGRSDLYLLKKYTDTYFKKLRASTNKINFPVSTVPIVQAFLKLDDLMKNIVISYIDIYKDEITKLDPDEQLYESFIKYFNEYSQRLLNQNTTRVNIKWLDKRQKSLFDSTIPFITAYDHNERLEYFAFIKKGIRTYKEHIDTLKLKELSKFSKSLFLVEKYSLARGDLHDDMVVMFFRHMFQKLNKPMSNISPLSRKIFEQADKFITDFMSIKQENDGFDFESKLLTYKREDLHDTAKYLVRVYLGLVRISGSSKVTLTGEHLEPYFGTETINFSILNRFNTLGDLNHIRLRINKDIYIYPGFVEYMNGTTSDTNSRIYEAARDIINNHDLFALRTHMTKRRFLYRSYELELPNINVADKTIKKYMADLKIKINNSGVKILIERYMADYENVLSEFTTRFENFKNNINVNVDKIFEQHVFGLMKKMQDDDDVNQNSDVKRSQNISTIPKHIQVLMVACGIRGSGGMTKWISPSYVRSNPKIVLASIAIALGLSGGIALAVVPGGAAVIGAGFAAYGVELGATAGVGAVGGGIAYRKSILKRLREHLKLENNEPIRSIFSALYKKLKNAPSNVMKVISAIIAYFFSEKGKARLRLPLPPAIPPAPPSVRTKNTSGVKKTGNIKQNGNNKKGIIRPPPPPAIPPAPSVRNRNKNPARNGNIIAPGVPMVLPAPPSVRTFKNPPENTGKKKSKILNNKGQKLITMPKPPILHPIPPRVQHAKQRNTEANPLVTRRVREIEKTKSESTSPHLKRGVNLAAARADAAARARSEADAAAEAETEGVVGAAEAKVDTAGIRNRKKSSAQIWKDIASRITANKGLKKELLNKMIVNEQNLLEIRNKEKETALKEMYDTMKQVYPNYKYPREGNARSRSHIQNAKNVVKRIQGTPMERREKTGRANIAISVAEKKLEMYESVYELVLKVKSLSAENNNLSTTIQTVYNQKKSFKDKALDVFEKSLEGVVRNLDLIKEILNVPDGRKFPKKLNPGKNFNEQLTTIHDAVGKVNNIFEKYITLESQNTRNQNARHQKITGLFTTISTYEKIGANKMLTPEEKISMTAHVSQLKNIILDVDEYYYELEIATSGKKAWEQVATNEYQSQDELNTSTYRTQGAWLTPKKSQNNLGKDLTRQESKESANSQSSPYVKKLRK